MSSKELHIYSSKEVPAIFAKPENVCRITTIRRSEGREVAKFRLHHHVQGVSGIAEEVLCYDLYLSTIGIPEPSIHRILENGPSKGIERPSPWRYRQHPGDKGQADQRNSIISWMILTTSDNGVVDTEGYREAV